MTWQISSSTRGNRHATIGTVYCLPQALHRPKRQRCCASSSNRNSEYDDVGGDKILQNALADVLQIEVERMQAKQEIVNDVEARKANIRQKGEEFLQRLQQEYEEDTARTREAGSEVVSSTLGKLSELEDEVRAVRERLRADQQDLAEWEAQAAADRSKGLFFKQLYSEKAQGIPEQQAATKLRHNIISPAKQELGSSFRLFLFAYLAGALVVVLAQDLSRPEPSVAIDALYAALATMLGISALQERKALQEKVNEESRSGGDQHPKH